MSMLIPPQMINTMDLEDLWHCPVRRYMLPAFDDRRTDWPNHPTRQPRQPPRGGDVGGGGADPPLPHEGAGGDALHLPAVLRPLHPHGPGGQRRAAGGEAPVRARRSRSGTRRSSTTSAGPPASATWWSRAATSPTCPSRAGGVRLALLDIENIRDIRLASKGFMGMPQHFLQDKVLAGARAAGEEGVRARNVDLALHTHVNHARQLTPAGAARPPTQAARRGLPRRAQPGRAAARGERHARRSCSSCASRCWTTRRSCRTTSTCAT